MRAALFDYDGVLADTLDDMLRLAGETCAEMGYLRTPTAADLDALETMSFVDYGIQLGIPADRAQEFARRTMARFEARPRPPEIFAGMDDVVRRAARRGQVGIVTGSSARAVLRFIEAHRLGAHLDVLIPVEHPGSRADRIRAALALLGRRPEEACLIGDAVSDVRAGREVGVRSIAVAWGHQSPTRLEAAGADHVVDSPGALIELLERI
ncbi:MAG TPA: HAD hydrolase-like protein [Anaerolineales bacterium]|nr:HAD hydrolase-like protein [Anaerolineales bacterium]